MKKLFLLLLLVFIIASTTSFAESAEQTPTPIWEMDLSGLNILELTLLKLNVEDAIEAYYKESEPTAAPEADDLGIWIVKSYVDEFDLPTENKYIVNSQLFQGSFSNSATTDSDLTVRLLIDDEVVSIVLYEYGRSQVKNIYSKQRYYDISILDPSGVRHDLEGYIYADGDRIFVPGKDGDVIIKALQQGGTTRFSIIESDRRSTKYSFMIEDSSGFSNAYKALFE